MFLFNVFTMYCNVPFNVHVNVLVNVPFHVPCNVAFNVPLNHRCIGFLLMAMLSPLLVFPFTIPCNAHVTVPFNVPFNAPVHVYVLMLRLSSLFNVPIECSV